MPLSPARVLRTFRYTVYFDGVDDYVLKSSPSGFTSYEYTVSAWLRFTRLYTDERKPGSWFITNTWWGPIFSELTTDNRLLLRFGTSASKIDIRSNYRFDRSWHHVSLTAKSGVYGSIYVDGNLDTYVSTSQTFSPSDFVKIQLGFLWSSSAFQGYIAQVLIYSRTLSDSEILWNYLNPDNPVRKGLILWLQADPQYIKDIDGDGLLEWIDLSDNNNHGKIYGARLVELTRTPARTLTATRVLSAAR